MKPVLWLISLGLALATPQPAEACSHPCQLGERILIAPADGDTDVPLNAQVIVRWDGADLGVSLPALTPFVLRGPDATDLPAEVTYVAWASPRMASVVLRPLAPLQASTAYTVVYAYDL